MPPQALYLSGVSDPSREAAVNPPPKGDFAFPVNWKDARKSG